MAHALDLLTYLLNPLRACSHIRPTPRNAIVICPLPASRLAPTPPESLHLSLHVPSPRLFWSSPPRVSGRVQRMATLGIDVSGILLTWPIHLHLRFFTSNEMGSIPIRSWSSALVILFGQKLCRFLLRHLFWNTSSMWHIPLVTFQDSAAYSSALYVALENTYLCFLADRFRLPDVLQSRKC